MSCVDDILQEKKGWIDWWIYDYMEKNIQYVTPLSDVPGKVTAALHMTGYEACKREVESAFCRKYLRELTIGEQQELQNELEQYLGTQMKSRLEAKTVYRGYLRFYPVGQGLMCGIYWSEYRVDAGTSGWKEYVLWADYSLSVSSLELYDCGSTTYTAFGKSEIITVSLKKDCEIFRIRQVIAGAKCKYQIDNVYISHFDNDHVNGMGILLHNDSDFYVRTVTYHYLDPMQQLGQVLQWGEDWQEKEALLNPREYLLALCKQGRRDQGEKFPETRLMEIHAWEEKARAGENFPEEGGQQEDGQTGDGQQVQMCLVSESFSGIAEKTWTDVHRHCLILVPVPQNKDDYEKAKDAFSREMEHVISGYESMSLEQKREKVKELLIVPDYRKDINEIYKNLFGDPNRASMCLAIAGMRPSWENGGHYGGNVDDSISVNGCKWTVADIGNSGILLTGDTQLQDACGKEGKSWAVAIGNRLQANRIRPGCILLPHHGSENNIDENAFNTLMDMGTGMAFNADPPLWVVSYGFNYQFGHPHKTPCSLFSVHGGAVHQTSEKNKELRFDPGSDAPYYNNYKDREHSMELLGRGMLFHCRDHPAAGGTGTDDRGVTVVYG